MSEFQVPKLMTSGEVRKVTLTGNSSKNGDVLREAVGGWFQALDLKHPMSGEFVTMWMDEEGKYHEPVIVNEAANLLVDLAKPGLMPGDVIVGNVVLTGLVDGEEGAEPGPVPESWAATIKQVSETVIEAMAQQPFEAIAYLNVDARFTEYEPSHRLATDPAFKFTVMAESPQSAAESVWIIGNKEVVAGWPAWARSLSVGDVIVVGDTALAVAKVGFTEVSLPTPFEPGDRALLAEHNHASKE